MWVAHTNGFRRGSRALGAMVGVLVLHAAVVIGLLATRSFTSRHAVDGPAMVLLDVSVTSVPATLRSSTTFEPQPMLMPDLQPPSIDVAGKPDDSNSMDWNSAAEHAAGHIASGNDESTRVFGFPASVPAAPRARKPFGWDTSRTNRLEFLPDGGLTIRLNDRCALVVAPLLIGGCALGKIEARGDLFDGMKAPAEPGDWKDSSVPSPGR